MIGDLPAATDAGSAAPTSPPTVCSVPAAGTRVVVEGRPGVITSTSPPDGSIARVLWDDDGSESGEIQLARLLTAGSYAPDSGSRVAAKSQPQGPLTASQTSLPPGAPAEAESVDQQTIWSLTDQIADLLERSRVVTRGSPESALRASLALSKHKTDGVLAEREKARNAAAEKAADLEIARATVANLAAENEKLREAIAAAKVDQAPAEEATAIKLTDSHEVLPQGDEALEDLLKAHSEAQSQATQSTRHSIAETVALQGHLEQMQAAAAALESRGAEVKQELRAARDLVKNLMSAQASYTNELASEKQRIAALEAALDMQRRRQAVRKAASPTNDRGSNGILVR